jgi:hypothetical protein
MFKITTIPESTDSLVLRLEGRLLADSVGELLTACGNAEGPQGRRVELDVAGLSFADVEGIETLRRLATRGLKVANASPFVAELLRENRT